MNKKIVLVCSNCSKEFERFLRANKKNSKLRFCSRKCQYIGLSKKILIKCKFCHTEFQKIPSHTNKYFCSLICMGNYTKKENKVECKTCQKIFFKPPNRIKKTKNHFCSCTCRGIFYTKKTLVECKFCHIFFYRVPSQMLRYTNIFCSLSCNASYNQANKIWGSSRSKLENWIELKLNKIYPNLIIYYNSKIVIGNELDIFIPSLNLAFEINGIFHYKPIFGTKLLEKIQIKDQKRKILCKEKNIELNIIDTSAQQPFKEETSWEYLNEITKFINVVYKV